jgi:hypothetical protein
VLDAGDAVPAGLTNIMAFDLAPGDRLGRPAKTITLGVQLPAQPCK